MRGAGVARLAGPGDLIWVALTMPRAERRARHAALMRVVEETDVARWRRRCIAALKSVERVVPVTGRSCGARRLPL